MPTSARERTEKKILRKEKRKRTSCGWSQDFQQTIVLEPKVKVRREKTHAWLFQFEEEENGRDLL